jgi:hypothetical protein
LRRLALGDSSFDTASDALVVLDTLAPVAVNVDVAVESAVNVDAVESAVNVDAVESATKGDAVEAATKGDAVEAAVESDARDLAMDVDAMESAAVVPTPAKREL